ncbi:MAG: cyclic pyranopterin phosphate synthase [Myxococcota bacterium]|jgi:cyclic pyranopterin phosphate synthase
MPEKMTFMPRADLLSFEEMEQLVGMFVESGISHLRITGGEPLARRGIVELVGRLSALPGIKDLSMTTNGVLLEPMAKDLAGAGLSRVNVSIDTICPDRFKSVTRWGELEPVLNGIRAARDTFEGPTKLNVVLVRGVNDDEAGDLIRWAGDEGVLLRFIEYMPIGIDNWWQNERFVPIDEIRDSVSGQGFTVVPLAGEAPVGGGPAQYWSVTPPGGTPSTVGFIAALTHNFCAGCNRVRLTSDGRVRECLTSGGALSLRDMLRTGKTRAEILAAIHEALYGKVDGHGFDAGSGTGGKHAYIPMSALGG